MAEQTFKETLKNFELSEKDYMDILKDEDEKEEKKEEE